jgi:magnesium chelatase family protein
MSLVTLGGQGKAEADAGVLTEICSCSAHLARRLTTILPDMILDEAIDTTRIQSIAGLTGDRTALVTTRPRRAPHHPISDVGLIGAGHVPMPGDVALAHHGVLVSDARPESRRPVLEVLRQPLEEGGHGRTTSRAA